MHRIAEITGTTRTGLLVLLILVTMFLFFVRLLAKEPYEKAGHDGRKLGTGTVPKCPYECCVPRDRHGVFTWTSRYAGGDAQATYRMVREQRVTGDEVPQPARIRGDAPEGESGAGAEAVNDVPTASVAV